MGFGEGYELVNIWLNGFDASLHCRNSIRLTTKTNTTTHYGPKLSERKIGRSSPMHSFYVTSKDKYFIGLKFVNSFRGIIGPGYIVVGSHLWFGVFSKFKNN